jgi:hypothetical protein
MYRTTVSKTDTLDASVRSAEGDEMLCSSNTLTLSPRQRAVMGLTSVLGSNTLEVRRRNFRYVIWLVTIVVQLIGIFQALKESIV